MIINTIMTKVEVKITSILIGQKPYYKTNIIHESIYKTSKCIHISRKQKMKGTYKLEKKKIINPFFNPPLIIYLFEMGFGPLGTS